MTTVPRQPRTSDDELSICLSADKAQKIFHRPGISAWRAGRNLLAGLLLSAAVVSFTGCVGTTTSSSTNYNRQLFSKNKFVEPKTRLEASGEKTSSENSPAIAENETAGNGQARQDSGAESAAPAVLSSSVSVAGGEGLIDQFICTKGLAGDLATGRAGQMLLASAGLAVEEAAPLAEIRSTPMIIAENVSEVNPAPSAGTGDMGEPSQTSSLSGRISNQTEGLLVTAYEQTGRNYKAGGQSPATGFDAAGFTRWVYNQRGVILPQGAKMQAAGGRQVAKEELRPGDLLVYRDPSEKGDDYHVGIYTGQGNFLHAAAKSGVVTETAAFGPQYSPYFVGGRRYYDDPKAAPLSDSRKVAAASRAVKLALSELGPNDKPNRSTGKSKSKKKK